MSIFETLLIIAIILISGFMAGSEIALFSLSRFQLRHLRDRSQNTYKKIKKLLSDPAGLLITVLVINEGLNIALSSLITQAVAARNQNVVRTGWLSGFSPWVAAGIQGTLITAPIVLIFCEITPKVIAARANQLIAPLCTDPLLLAYKLLKPIRIVLMRIVRTVSMTLNRYSPDAIDSSIHRPLKEEEFLVMIEEGHREGTIHQSEMDLIRNIFELDDTPVIDILTPISEVFTLSSDTPIEVAQAAIQNQRYSRIPITDPLNLKKVTGILYRKDLFLAQLEPEFPKANVENLARKPFTVASTLKLNSLFRRLKQYQTHLGIVENEQGEAIGIVTMTDVLDAIFEDILEATLEDAR